jgi:hypothetical protein
MSDETFVFGCLGAFGVLMVGAGIGWVMNIIKIFAALSEPLTGMFIARVLGVFLVPVGCIAGWL